MIRQIFDKILVTYTLVTMSIGANINNLVSESAYGTESAKESTTFSLLSDDYSVLSGIIMMARQTALCIMMIFLYTIHVLDGQDDLKITQTDKGVFPSVPKGVHNGTYHYSYM